MTWFEVWVVVAVGFLIMSACFVTDNMLTLDRTQYVDSCSSVCESNNLSYHGYHANWMTTDLYECECLPLNCISGEFREISSECEITTFRKV
jgi:hypothetical protein